MTVALQLKWFMLMAWTGWQLTALLDTLRVTIRVGRIPYLIGHLLILLYSAAAGLYLFRQLYLLNGGEIRGALLLAAALGGLLYWRFFRKLLRPITESIVRIIRFVLQYCKRFLVFVLVRPLRWLLRMISIIIFAGIARLKRWIPKPLKIALTNCRNHIKMLVQRLTKFD